MAGLHQAGQVGHVLLDADVEGQNLLALGVEEEGVGLAHLGGQQEDAARRAHHRIDDIRIGDQHIARVGIELHDRRLVERQGQALMGGAAAGGNGDHLRIGLIQRGGGQGSGNGKRRGERQSQADQDGAGQFHCGDSPEWPPPAMP